jgi:hypothetical protein
LGDEATLVAPLEKSYTGMIVQFAPKDRVLIVKASVFSKKAFNLGENCQFKLRNNTAAGASDLRIGQKITVKYQDAHGILIANHISQLTMRREGTVTVIEPDKHLLVLNGGRHLQIAGDCKIILRDGKLGSFSDIKVGNYVSVIYETPNESITAREIVQTSIACAGTLTAIDLQERTLKIKTTFSIKKFNLADNCSIIIQGEPAGKLSDLRPNEQLQIDYDEIDGVNVATRIAPVRQRQ